MRRRSNREKNGVSSYGAEQDGEEEEEVEKPGLMDDNSPFCLHPSFIYFSHI